MPEESTSPDRWFLIVYRTGRRAASQPMDGFATKGEAVAWHRDFTGGDLRYVVRCDGIDGAGATAERLAKERE